MGISREQALDCFRSDDLIGIGMEADAVRRRLHPEGVVSYGVERAIDCADWALEGPECEAIYKLVEDTLEIGGTGVLLRVALERNIGPKRRIEWFERLFAGIKQRHSSIWLSGLTALDVRAIAEASGLDLRDTIARLHDAGLDSIAGEGGDIAGLDAWIEVHRTAHELGMRTVAAMVFGAGAGETGAGEAIEQRVDFLEAVRRLQEETGGFTAFVPLSFQAPGGGGLDGATAVECLKTLAISRMFLDNIENVQVNWTEQGLKVRQMGLRFGGNDVGSVMLGAGTVKGGGATNSSEEDLRRIIRDAGFRPVQRDLLYRTMCLN